MASVTQQKGSLRKSESSEREREEKRGTTASSKAETELHCRKPRDTLHIHVFTPCDMKRPFFFVRCLEAIILTFSIIHNIPHNACVVCCQTTVRELMVKKLRAGCRSRAAAGFPPAATTNHFSQTQVKHFA